MRKMQIFDLADVIICQFSKKLL